MYVTPQPRPTRAFQRGLLVAVVILGLASAHPATAAWPHDPYIGNVPVCTQSAAQTNVQACSDGAGGMILVWVDYRLATAPDLYAQRLSATGEPQWTLNGIALCTAANAQDQPAIVADGNGGAIVTWRDGQAGAYDIYAQRVNANGALQWATRGVPVSVASNSQQFPHLASDGAGGAVICWQDFRNNLHNDIYAQRLNGLGVAQWAANGVLLCGAAGAQDEPRIVFDGAAGAIIAWRDARAGANAAIYARRVNSGGTPQWTVDGVPICTGAFPAIDPEIETDMQGGAIVVWRDPRNGAGIYGVFAQRIDPTGAAQWTINGVAATTDVGPLTNAYVCSDGAGGVIVGWDIFHAASNYDVLAQRIGAGGAPQWATAGVNLMQNNGDQILSAISSDGAGGAIVAVTDYRGGISGDIYAQHVLANGTRSGPADGTPICAAVGAQHSAVLVRGGITNLVGLSGVLLAWLDNRNDPSIDDIYAQQLDYFGELGDAAPILQSVRDIPNDQGGQVKITWGASYLDTESRYQYMQYRVWRSVAVNTLAGRAALLNRGVTRGPQIAAESGRLLLHGLAGTDYAWEVVASQSCDHVASYHAVVSTTSDSLPGSNPLTAYMVELSQYGVLPRQAWYSMPDSGYSVDNLKPATPAPFAGFYNAGTTRLVWGPNREADLAGYRIYRGVTPGFIPSPATLFAAQLDTGYVNVAGAPFVYKLVAVDIHGNESTPATFVPSATVDAPVAGAARFAFAPPAPNPARGTTLLRYALPRAGTVRLAVFDPAGRRVRTLHDGAVEAGEHALRFALADDDGHALPSGLYLIRLEADGQTLTRRVMAVR